MKKGKEKKEMKVEEKRERSIDPLAHFHFHFHFQTASRGARRADGDGAACAFGFACANTAFADADNSSATTSGARNPPHCKLLGNLCNFIILFLGLGIRGRKGQVRVERDEVPRS